tara:strand:+ start:125 stop:718 length:594 start_codon:yes stop_codon:yes gene_type:complete
MSREKPQIKIKNLSWEEKKFYFCDDKNCKKEGKYKAPKSKIDLNNYYFFCLKHIKEYNKSWDYYKGMSIDQIELSIRQDIIWNRPTWPTNKTSKKIFRIVDGILSNKFDFFETGENLKSYYSNNRNNLNLTINEKKSIEKLGIDLPITVEKIKFSYKKLVKKYHPDINKSDKNAEKQFKEINSAYKLLLKKFVVNTI